MAAFNTVRTCWISPFRLSLLFMERINLPADRIKRPVHRIRLRRRVPISRKHHNAARFGVVVRARGELDLELSGEVVGEDADEHVWQGQFPSRAGSSKYGFTSSYGAPRSPFGVGTWSPPAAVTACAVRCCACIASAVTTRPFGAGIPNSVGIAAIPSDPPSTRTCPNTGRTSPTNAHARIGRGVEREAASENDRRNTLPSMAITPPSKPGRPALGKPQHRPLQVPGIRRIERVGEGVAARNAVRQAHETARKPLLGTAEALRIGATLAAARRRRKTDHRHPVQAAERRATPMRVRNSFKYMSKLPVA